MKLNLTIPLNTRQFIRDYRLPLAATLAFVVVVLLMFTARLREHGTLGQIFAVSQSGGDYASLISNDKHDDFVKRDVGTDSSPTAATDSRQGTVTTAPVSLSTGGSVTPPAGGGTTPPVTGTPPPAVFTAVITDFRQDQSPSLQCPNGLLGSLNLNKCSKTYSFSASVQTANGPGTVNYDWIYSVNGSSNGSFVAASGTNITTLHHQISLSCKDPGTFTAQFALNSPLSTQSSKLQISHSC